MNIVKQTIPTNNYDKSRKPITHVVIHWIVGSLASADATFKNPARGASAHYGIENSTVFQWVDEAHTAYHAGKYAYNQKSIGIEHSAAPDRVASEATYQSSGQLVKEICQRHNIPLDRTHIVGHKEVSATQCPGTMNIDKIISIAKGGGSMTSYKGYDLDNKDSMKVAVDVLVRVQAGEFVDKPEAEKTIRELEAKTEQINELTKENFDLNTEVVRLRDEIAELKSANQTLNNKIIDLNAAMEKDAVHDRDLEVKNTELEHQITELNNQITKLKEEKQAPLEPVIDHYEPILEEFWKNLFKGKSRKSISDKFWEWVR